MSYGDDGVAVEFFPFQIGADADKRCLALSFQSARDRERSLTNRQPGVPVMKDLHVTHL
jgi:hypothetical protein